MERERKRQAKQLADFHNHQIKLKQAAKDKRKQEESSIEGFEDNEAEMLSKYKDQLLQEYCLQEEGLLL